MATFELYDVNKRKNSTSAPKPGTGIYPDFGESVGVITGEFREPFDFLNPVVVFKELDRASTTWGQTWENNPPNYAVWRPTNLAESIWRAYWITNIVWLADDLAEVHMHEDVLATWATDIMNSYQYVLRSSYTFDGAITDSWYPIEAVTYSYNHTISTDLPWYMATPSLASGYYIVGIVNDDDNAYGAVSYYLFPQQAFVALRHELLNSTSWTNMNFTEISEELYQSLFNPMQYIASVKWFPFAPDLTGRTGQGYIDIGWWKNIALGLSVCYPLTSADFIATDSVTLSVDNHPQASTRGSYLQAPPYRRRCLYIEPFGTIEINTALLTNPLNAPTLTYWVDFVTGKAKIRVTNSLGAIVGESETVMGVDISVAQSTQDVMGVIGGAVSALSGAASSAYNFATGNVSSGISGITSAASGISSAISSAVPTISSSGANGSILAFGTPMMDITYYNEVADEDNADFGRPLCRNVKLSTLQPGFVKCLHPHITSNGANATERAEIERYLSDGIFVEDWWQR